MAIEFETRDDVKCPHCGVELEEISQSFCMHCKERIDQDAYHCECGTHFFLVKGYEYCYECGRPIKRESTESQMTEAL